MEWSKESFRISLPRKISSAIASEELVGLLMMDSAPWTHLSRELRLGEAKIGERG